MLYLRLTSALFLIFLICSSQIDPHKLDSLRRSIDSSAHAVRKYQDSMNYVQHHIPQQNFSDSNRKEKQGGVERTAKKEKDLPYTGLLIGIAFLIVLILLIRDQSKKQGG